MLVPVIQWAIHRLDPEVEILEPEFRKRRGSVGPAAWNFKRSIANRRVSVAEYISDYSPLMGLPAFLRFQESLAACYPYRV